MVLICKVTYLELACASNGCISSGHDKDNNNIEFICHNNSCSLDDLVPVFHNIAHVEFVRWVRLGISQILSGIILYLFSQQNTALIDSR